MIKTPVVTALSTAFGAVTLGSDDAYGFDVFCDDQAIDYTIHSAVTGGTALVKGTTVLSFPHHEEAGAIVMYAKAASGTPNLVLIPHRHNNGR